MAHPRRTLQLLAMATVLASAKTTAGSELRFSTSGSVSSLVLAGKRRRITGDSGFYLISGKIKGKRLAVQTQGKNLIVSRGGGLPRFTLRVDSYNRHVSLHMVKAEGIASPPAILEFRLPVATTLGAINMDRMLYFPSYGRRNREIKYSFNPGEMVCQWKYLGNLIWKKNDDGRLGDLAIYDNGASDREADETMAEIWSTEKSLPRPAVEPWDPPHINRWVDEFKHTYCPRTNTLFLVEATNPKELYELTDFALRHHVKRIYLHCKTWRGEYWLKKMSIDDVNRNVFPKGYSDVAAYADYLHKRGAVLHCHNVSLHIGMSDDEYITKNVDRRLDAWWGRGQLARDALPQDSTLYYRPDPGARLPEYSPDMVTDKRVTWDHIRIGNEIIKVGEYQDTNKPVWRLTKCKRGMGSTQAIAHTAGEKGAGIWVAYNKVIVPPYDIGKPNSILKELAARYANLINKTRMDHLHFDGIEIHRINPVCEKIAIDLTYSNVKRVVDISRVGGPGIASFELAFRRVPPWTYRNVVIPLRLEKKTPKALKKGTWLSSDWLAAHFSIANCILYGSRVLAVSSPIGGEGITMDTLQKHGLTERIFALMKDWSMLLPQLTPADFAYLKTIMKRRKGGHHYQSEDIPVLIKENGTYKLQPYRIMTRSSGKKLLNYFVQEGGTHEPKQSIHTGEQMTLRNPYDPQPPLLYLRVTETNKRPLVNPKITVGRGYAQVMGRIEPSQYLYYDGSAGKAKVYDRNWKLMSELVVRKQGFEMPHGQAGVSVHTESTAKRDQLSIEVQFITRGPKYVLGANKALAVGKNH